MIFLICCKIRCLYLSTHTLLGLWLASFKNFWKALVTAIRFGSFKWIIHAYLLKISITHNANPVLKMLINWILAKSALPNIVYKRWVYFLSLNFLITGLFNSSANSLFEMFLFLLLVPASIFARVAEFFYYKICKPLIQIPINIHDI